MLRPFLIIGVGGSGGKTVRALRHSLELRLQQVGWTGGIPRAWQMVHVDTPVKQDGEDYVMPFLPAEQYKGLVATGATYEGVHSSIMFGDKLGGTIRSDVERVLPDPRKVDVILTIGAGQYRAVGRVPALSRLGEIGTAVQNAIDRMTDAAAIGELASLGDRLKAKSEGGQLPNPTVIVISSIAGGSGAGQYLDVIEAAKERFKGQPTGEQFYSLLFAPDVFDQVKDIAGVPGNALAAISETTNGFWTQRPSASTIGVYNSRGLSPSYGGARDRVGAAYPFLIGRQNSKVAFADQGEVYSAVSASVAAWMLDDVIQGNIDSYAAGNLAANAGADVLTDRSRLMRRDDQRPPFKSLGFGRVTLGREKFLDYASERFARAVVDRMLFAHSEDDPRFERSTEEEQIEARATQALGAFITEARLDEETEDRNQVIDELRPAEAHETLAAEFRQNVLEYASQGVDARGQDISTWQHRLLTARDDQIRSFIARDVANLHETVSAWITAAPVRLVDAVERAIARHGIPVTVELLRDLARALDAASDNLRSEGELRRGWVHRLAGYVSEDLSVAANPDSVRRDQDVVETALNRIVDSYDWEFEANLRDVASRLLKELREAVVEPLRTNLEGSRRALLARVKAAKQDDDRQNEYPFWPAAFDSTVPRKYEPAPNERLLTKHTEYAVEFERLVSASFEQQRFRDAMLDAIGELISGPGDGSGIPAGKRWSTVDVTASWKPSTTADLAQRSAEPGRPRFEVADELDVYLARAKAWMMQPGKAFAAYIEESLLDYFDRDHVAPDVYRDRKDDYREALLAALAAAEPLVKLNAKLLREVHDKAIDEPARLIFSAIPFKEGTDLYEITKSALISAGVWDDNVSPRWFQDAQTDGIEVFAMSRFPYEPMVMDSVMLPIARGWLANSSSDDSRAAFWRWKRGRLLREAAPVDPVVFDSIVRGWYAAKALSQLKVENDPNKGPRLSVWDPRSRDWVAFPHPLLYAGTAPSHDFPGAVLESVSIALALCSAEGTMAPLRPYHVLLDLGGGRESLSPTFATWLQTGAMPDHAPAPLEERVGPAGGTLQQRQEAARAFLDRELAEFREVVVEQDVQASVYTYPVSWEIRETVTAALQDLRDGVLETKPATSGV